MEDYFVLDAPTLWCERSGFGQLTGLHVIDGGTIKRVIDDFGRTPRPFPWDGHTPFQFCGQPVDASNLIAAGFKWIAGKAYPPAFQQILKGLPAVNYTTHDIIQQIGNPRPGKIYGMSPVEMVLSTVSIAMRRAQNQLAYFTEGNEPQALYSLPESWNPDQVQKFQNYWDGVFSGHLGKRRKLKFLAGGSKNSYVPIHEPPLKSEFDEWLARIICFAFSYPPTAFVNLSNRSVGEQHERTAEEEGLEPTKQWACELINGIITRDFGESEIEFCWIEEDDVNQQTQSEILTSYAKTGVLSINEIRERLGEEPAADPSANMLMIATQTGYVPIGNNQNTQQGANE
jgi:hypothetical protein